MDESPKGTRRILAGPASWPRGVWTDIVLLVLAVVIVGLGFYVWSQPARTTRADIWHYNQGVSAYHEPPGLLPASDERPSEYPIERAAAYWEQAATESEDPKLKSLALYNAGTLVAREAYASTLAFGLVDTPRVEMTQAIIWLREAIRYDAENEDAKYNLEVLERVQFIEGEKEGAPGEGYSPGAVDKGY
jgi:hypothetical protein